MQNAEEKLKALLAYVKPALEYYTTVVGSGASLGTYARNTAETRYLLLNEIMKILDKTTTETMFRVYFLTDKNKKVFVVTEFQETGLVLSPNPLEAGIFDSVAATACVDRLRTMGSYGYIRPEDVTTETQPPPKDYLLSTKAQDRRLILNSTGHFVEWRGLPAPTDFALFTETEAAARVEALRALGVVVHSEKIPKECFAK